MRLDYTKVAPEGLNRIYALQNYVSAHTNLDQRLVLLLQLRASQINGCAFCMHMHTIELKELGETDARIDCLCAWEETDLYDDRERAALAWAEAVTKVGEGHVPDSVYELAKKHFDDKDLADLTLAVCVINVWNRLSVAFRVDPKLAPIVIEQAKSARRQAASLV